MCLSYHNFVVKFYFYLMLGNVCNAKIIMHFFMAHSVLRCHTFGIGPEVCVELVTGIAAASGGRCVLLAEGGRLQTKVCLD